MRCLVVLAVTVLVAACASAAPHWVGDNLRDVDGYVLDNVRTCRAPLDGDCSIAVPAALRTLDAASAASVTGTSIGTFPRAYTNGSGQTILRATGGFMETIAVILDGSNGPQVVVVLCGPDTYDADGSVASRSCEPLETDGRGNPVPSP